MRKQSVNGTEACQRDSTSVSDIAGSHWDSRVSMRKQSVNGTEACQRDSTSVSDIAGSHWGSRSVNRFRNL